MKIRLTIMFFAARRCSSFVSSSAAKAAFFAANSASNCRLRSSNSWSHRAREDASAASKSSWGGRVGKKKKGGEVES